MYCIFSKNGNGKGKEFVFRCTVKVASRWNPSLATCLVATGTKAAGYPQIWSFEEQCFPHHPSKCKAVTFSHRARYSYTILDCVYSDTNGIFYILDMMCWDGYQVRNNLAYSSILTPLPSSVLWLRHWVPPRMGPAKVHREPGESSTYGTINIFCMFDNVRSFGSGQESILTVFSPFQSIR